MVAILKIKGVKATIGAFKTHTQKGKLNLERGLIKAGLFLQRESQKLCPVKTTNLKANAFTRKEEKKGGVAVRVGYVAEYAVYVHEMTGNYHHVGQAKFLEQPAREKEGEMKEIIKKEMKKK